MDQMIAWYQEGKSRVEIAAILGSAEWQDYWISQSGKGWQPTTTSVNVAMRAAGCIARNQSERAVDRHPAKRPWPFDTMIAMYNDGYSLQEIANILASDEWQPYWVQYFGEEYRPGTKIVNKVMKKRTVLRGRGAPGHRNGFWKGGRHIDKGGYILVHRPQSPMANAHGFVREHRLVMAKMIGRDLLPTEVVHHIDEDTGNNDETNLMLFDTNAEHIRATTQGRWSEAAQISCRRKMVLNRRPDLVLLKNTLIRRLHSDLKLSISQIGLLLDHYEATVSRYLDKLAIHDRHPVAGTLTDSIHEECRRFLAILDQSTVDEPLSLEIDDHPTE